jgi:hypothetical protein
MDADNEPEGRRRPGNDVMRQQAQAMRDFFVQRAIRRARIAEKRRARGSAARASSQK